MTRSFIFCALACIVPLITGCMVDIAPLFRPRTPSELHEFREEELAREPESGFSRAEALDFDRRNDPYRNR